MDGEVTASSSRGDLAPLNDPRHATLALVAARVPGATVCPSEVARALAVDWRSMMPAVHAAVDRLVIDGLVQLSWKGKLLERRDGPYRIGRGSREPISSGCS